MKISMISLLTFLRLYFVTKEKQTNKYALKCIFWDYCVDKFYIFPILHHFILECGTGKVFKHKLM